MCTSFKNVNVIEMNYFWYAFFLSYSNKCHNVCNQTWKSVECFINLWITIFQLSKLYLQKSFETSIHRSCLWNALWWSNWLFKWNQRWFFKWHNLSLEHGTWGNAPKNLPYRVSKRKMGLLNVLVCKDIGCHLE